MSNATSGQSGRLRSASRRRRPAKRGRPGTGGIKRWKRKNGDTGFALRFHDQHGERQRVRCGMESEGWSEERADILLRELLDQVRRGVYAPPPEPVDEDEADPLFGDFAPAMVDRRHGASQEDATEICAGEAHNTSRVRPSASASSSRTTPPSTLTTRTQRNRLTSSYFVEHEHRL
jgi:hypothetical protein